MLDQTQAEADLDAAAASLLNAPLVAATPAVGGGNNRVYRAETRDGAYAIKFYPRQNTDPRDRLSHEFAALTLMNAHGIGGVPRAYASDAELGCAAYEWIDGNVPGTMTDTDIDAMSALAMSLAAIGADAAESIGTASAGCFSGADVTAQFSARLARLRDVADDPALNAFLDERLAPGFNRMSVRAREIYAGSGVAFDAPLDSVRRTLSPSDFGFHNALRRPDGDLVFLDFEYFGWDDPVKMIADACWHPGSALTESAVTRFETAMLAFFAARDGEALRIRYEALSPLFGMIWCLIVLNEFLPERWARRVLAGGAGDIETARRRQLDMARTLFTRVTQRYDD
ncbi:MAG: aminoglycoside phosphotransferase family protein [Rhodospirillales bacterium]